LRDELNIAAELEHVYQFCYQAGFERSGSENELCHVYLGRLCGEVRPNDSEIESVRLITVTDLERELLNQAENFTPWFKQEWCRLKQDFFGQLERYAI
jgi:isopentenyl-diphosphate delta-isomerase